ncbi:hypothetical protein DBR39_05545 [Chryseobacterium sp. KBW03]|uniref:DUF2321 domain-containing protein n=1 Tax=Chryseobacterium sp. KBW03 TaxID=2153362 RepID=UPI000F598081|nr:DUF2321 domain-containing protein [Chryseobacterium sp. KBW03]RQO40413.1 hypothetical protein DBR39_05545 [Chryseobacterium sp. KBW03]
MGKYDAYLVCKNGHGVNDSYYRSPEFNEKFCTICGELTFKSCPNCNQDIQGDYHTAGVIDLTSISTPVPDICKYCGKDFPWRSKTKTISTNIIKSDKDDIILLETIFDKFHLVAKQMRQRYDDRPTLDIKDEYDAQDLLHSLLRIYYEDIRTEEWNPSYAGSSTRSDFLLKDQQIVIEIKKTRNTLKAKQLGEQLIIDIAKYKTHPNCKLLYCFVYDPEGYISNPRGMENDLNSSSSEMKVKVKIVPKGH